MRQAKAGEEGRHFLYIGNMLKVAGVDLLEGAGTLFNCMFYVFYWGRSSGHGAEG